MLNVAEPDSCCGEALSEALSSGSLDAETRWVHEDCGTAWNGVMVGPVKMWTPTAVIEFWI